jgi:HEAT repeat protein
MSEADRQDRAPGPEIDAAHDLLRSSDLDERARGVDVLSGIPGAEATNALAKILHETSWFLRDRAAQALAQREGGVGATLRVLEEGTWFARASGCDALGRAGESCAFAALVAQILDRNVSVQKSAADAIHRLTEIHGVNLLVQEIGLLPQPDRRAAIARLAHQRPELAPALIASLPAFPPSASSEDSAAEVAALKRFRAWIASHVASGEAR